YIVCRCREGTSRFTFKYPSASLPPETCRPRHIYPKLGNPLAKEMARLYPSHAITTPSGRSPAAAHLTQASAIIQMLKASHFSPDKTYPCRHLGRQCRLSHRSA